MEYKYGCAGFVHRATLMIEQNTGPRSECRAELNGLFRRGKAKQSAGDVVVCFGRDRSRVGRVPLPTATATVWVWAGMGTRDDERVRWHGTTDDGWASLLCSTGTKLNKTNEYRLHIQRKPIYP